MALLLMVLSLTTAVTLTAPRIVRANPGVRYAAPRASGSGDCSSWGNACTLQTALTGAVSGDEIWVKAGVHYPGTNRTDTSQLKNGVAVYGGFAGTETSRNQCNPRVNQTILSSDIDQNDINTDGNFIAERPADIQGSNASYTLSVHTAIPAYQPLSLQDCQTLQADLTRAFGMRFTLIDTPFTDPITGASGMACTLEANGTGADFGALPEVMTKVRSVLAGWQENPLYAADSPTASMTAFTRDRALLVAMASWEPRADADCPTDQPISACPLTPEQQLFSMRLQGVQY